MRRAGKRSVALLAAIGALAVAPSARAFHAGDVFDKPPGAGGGGGVFYTGAASERGWDCTACHTSAARAIKVTLAADPPALLQSLRFTPGAKYALTATLEGEHLGAGPSNFNALAVAFVDDAGLPAGDLSGYAADEFYSGRTTIVSAGQHPGETRWSFVWTAPSAPGARVRLHLAAVDGNGASGGGRRDADQSVGRRRVRRRALARVRRDGEKRARPGARRELGDGGVRVLLRRAATTGRRSAMRGTMIVVGCTLLFACGAGSTKDDPCPQGICIASGAGADGGGASSSSGGASSSSGGPGTCNAAWTCTAWQKNAQGQYTRTCTDANGCGTASGKPSEGPIDLPDLDMDFYKCSVEPIFDRGCAMLGCHGTEIGRPFKIYARARLRHQEMVPGAPTCPNPGTMRDLSKEGTGTAMCLGWSKHTAAEWQQNYDNARSFMVGLTNPDDSDLLAQPRYGGKAHTGVHLFAKTDADYQTISAWLGGKKLGTACDPSPN